MSKHSEAQMRYFLVDDGEKDEYDGRPFLSLEEAEAKRTGRQTIMAARYEFHAYETVSEPWPAFYLLVDGERLEKLADALGYENIEWDSENDCYSGYGSADPYDRSRDDAGGFYVAKGDAELETIAKQCLRET